MTEPGLYPGMSEADYFADTSALSASAAKTLLGKRPPDPDAPALVFGTLVHRVLLEPDRLDVYEPLDPAKYGTKADGTPAANPMMTAAWKKAATRAAVDGKIAIPVADWDRAHRMVDAVRNHPGAAELLAVCPDREISAYGTNTETGAPVRGRFDLFGPDVLADLKTTENADPDSWTARVAAPFGYHISAANYLDLARQHGHRIDEVYFINVEKEPALDGRHRVSIITLTRTALEQGAAEMAEACRRWLAAGRRVDLPDYPSEPVICDLPRWAYRDYGAAADISSTPASPALIPADFEWSLHEYT